MIEGGGCLHSEKNINFLTNENSECVIVPPGCENKMLFESGEKVITFMPESYKPYIAENNRKIPHSMNGVSRSLSVPKSDTSAENKNITDYLSRFKNANLCLDLWLKNSNKIKKCGVLLDVGKDFIILNETGFNRISIIDLKPVYYISIYCKSNL